MSSGMLPTSLIQFGMLPLHISTGEDMLGQGQYMGWMTERKNDRMHD